MALKPRSKFKTDVVEAIEGAAVAITPGEPDVIIRRGTLWPADHPVVKSHSAYVSDLG